MMLNWIILILAAPVLFFAARILVDTIHPQTKLAMIMDRRLEESREEAQERLHRSMLRYTVHVIEEEKRKKHGSVDS